MYIYNCSGNQPFCNWKENHSECTDICLKNRQTDSGADWQWHVKHWSSFTYTYTDIFRKLEWNPSIGFWVTLQNAIFDFKVTFILPCLVAPSIQSKHMLLKGCSIGRKLDFVHYEIYFFIWFDQQLVILTM